MGRLFFFLLLLLHSAHFLIAGEAGDMFPARIWAMWRSQQKAAMSGCGIQAFFGTLDVSQAPQGHRQCWFAPDSTQASVLLETEPSVGCKGHWVLEPSTHGFICCCFHL